MTSTWARAFGRHAIIGIDRLIESNRSLIILSFSGKRSVTPAPGSRQPGCRTNQRRGTLARTGVMGLAPARLVVGVRRPADCLAVGLLRARRAQACTARARQAEAAARRARGGREACDVAAGTDDADRRDDERRLPPPIESHRFHPGVTIQRPEPLGRIPACDLSGRRRADVRFHAGG